MYTRILIALSCFLAPASALAIDHPIAYVRCERTTAEFDVTMDVVLSGVAQSMTRTMRGLDVYDIMPDVTHFFSGFSAPCDLVLREPDGQERVLYSCSDTSTEENACAAMDPAVSFDGKTIAFSVFRGSLTNQSEPIHPRVVHPDAENAQTQRMTLPNRVLSATEAQLHLVDVETGEVRELPHEEGAFDAGPTFLANGRIAFTSSREGHTATMVFGTNSSGRGSRIYTVDPDGKNLDIASHHSLAQEQHPFALKDGRVAYTSWQIFGGLAFRHTNGSPGGFTTIGNLFHIYTQYPDGAEQFAFYGQHAGDHTPVSATNVDHKAAHFLTQTSDERVWFADYYRGNNSGLGVVVGVMPEPEGQEGIGPHEAEVAGDIFAPRDIVRLTQWSTSGDNMARPMPEPAYTHPAYADPLPFAGKVGHPSALPQNGLMVAWGKGACSTVSGNGIFATLGMEAPPLTSGSGAGTAMNVITSLGLDTPGCDVGLYRATAFPSTHPSDLELIVDSRDWHEIQARAVVPYSAIHGIEKPVLIEPADLRASHPDLEVGTPFGLLGAASIVDRETHPWGGLRFQGEGQFHRQGTDTIEYQDDDLCGVRILALLPNRGRDTWKEISNTAGERVRILGEFPVRKTQDPYDTSFLVRFPANIPYMMHGIDCDGRTLNTDQTWQSLRPGEVKTCGGCHVHSRPSNEDFADTLAARPDYTTHKLGEGVVPILAGGSLSEVSLLEYTTPGLSVTFEEDILPIFEQRCASCHSSDSPAAGLVLDRPGIEGGDTPSTWFCLVRDKAQTCVPEELKHTTGAGGSGHTFRRPQLTRYLRAFNSRASLLYWKAANQRTDLRTDDTFSDPSDVVYHDIDFGADHPTDMTAEELGLLSRWIDIGAAGGPDEKRDTLRPTLNLAATIDGASLTRLHVGTADIGSGVDGESLEVCVMNGDACGPNLASAAHSAGVVSIDLASPLSDPELEIRASVSDLAGNQTVVQRTVSWLLRSPPEPPVRPETPVDPENPENPDPNNPTNPETPGASASGDKGCGCGAAQGPANLFILLLLFGVQAFRRARAYNLPPVSG